jgi:hypothetical protein
MKLWACWSAKAGNTNGRGRLSTVDLPTKLARFAQKVKKKFYKCKVSILNRLFQGGIL